ncbi:MFS general substrate transporter [Lactarius pseudohatsudake]|nr:MFS general substrate transporter [Lactarius pseudohatsudake]
MADDRASHSEKHKDDGVTTELIIQADTENVFEHDSLDPLYAAKAKILNDALQEIGMGRYQWYLFVVAGFGWLSDNLWPIVTGLIFTSVTNEFAFKGPFLKLGQNIGLLVGAVFWGVGSDVWGRKLSFNLTLLITGIFAVAAGASPDSITLCSLAAVWSIGVGGNLPVDSAVFLEFIPASHQYLLTVLSIWWALGQLLGSLVAWPLLANFSCPTTVPPSPCPRSENQGWRYFLYAMGGLMLVLFVLRFFVFHLYESPKYLMGRGRDAEAVEVVHKVAGYNGKSSSLTLDMLRDAEGQFPPSSGNGDPEKTQSPIMDASALGAARRTLTSFGWDHVTPLFRTRKLAWSTSLLIIIWGALFFFFFRVTARSTSSLSSHWSGVPIVRALFYSTGSSDSHPCPTRYNSFVTYFLATRGADFGDGSTYITYRNQVILSVIGVPGALLAGWTVELPFLGRRGSLAISTILTGVFLFASTTARTSAALLGWNCGYSFTSNIMYGVLYALSPELFPTKDRGTGNALVAAANRVFGIMAPIIALYASLTTSVPIYISGALFIVAGFVAVLLPFEPRGKASL